MWTTSSSISPALGENIYYLDVDLYRYFIGRSDQSVNEKVMVTRVDQQLRVTYQMIDSHDLRTVGADHKKLARYMFNYLAMMMAISSIFLVIDGRPEALGKRPSCGSTCAPWTPAFTTR